MSEAFTQLRPVFIVTVIVLLIFLVLSFVERSQSSGVTLFAVGSVSAVSLVIATTLLVMENQLVADMGWTGDSWTLYLYGAILLLSIANPIVYRQRNSRKTRYKFY